MIAALLARCDFEVATAGNGRQAIESHRASPANLIVLDMMMPEQDGLETMLELRRMRSAVPIIAISGGGLMSYKDVLKAAKTFGAAHTMAKPFALTEILETIRASLAVR